MEYDFVLAFYFIRYLEIKKRTMKVFLVNPASWVDKRAGVYSDSMVPLTPMGLCYLAAIARQLGHEVAVKDQYASMISAEQLAELAVKHRSDVVGISCLSPSMPMVEEISKNIRARLPAAHIVAGNIHATLFPEEMILRGICDTVAMGEGEETFGELLEKLETSGSLETVKGLAFMKDGNIVVNEARPLTADLDCLPYPAWDLLDLDDYLAPPRFMLRKNIVGIGASRGCPSNCSFCSHNIITPRMRIRDIVKVVNEMQWVVENLGASYFGFTDACFPLNERQGFEFCRLLKERDLHKKLKWFTETRSDIASFDLLREFKEAGCVFVMYGFESANVRHMMTVNKNLNPEKAFDVMKWHKKLKLFSYGLFMIGFPYETHDEARATIEYAKKLDCEVASFGRVTPYPGTPLYKEYKSTFPENVFPWQWNNQYRPKLGEKTWQLPGLSHQDINNLLREAMISYYLQPHMILKHLRLGIFSPKDIFKGAVILMFEFISRATSFFSYIFKKL